MMLSDESGSTSQRWRSSPILLDRYSRNWKWVTMTTGDHDLETLTSYEVRGLDRSSNLADGHAKLETLISISSAHWLQRVGAMNQDELESRFVGSFSKWTGLRLDAGDCIFAPSASMCIDTAAKYLAAEGASRVGLLTPTFDNLLLLLLRSGLQVCPVEENEDDILRAVRDLDAVVLVCPNNPTGWAPSNSFWEKISAILSLTNCSLVVDRTFRLHSQPFPALDALIAQLILMSWRLKTLARPGVEHLSARFHSSGVDAPGRADESLKLVRR